MKTESFARSAMLARHSLVASLLLILATSSFAAGDPNRGKELYLACATCHGQNGEGMQEMNAPALAGREAWYLARQLANFKSGTRGGPGDTFGQQMAPMAQLLADAQAIDDVAAYLSSLEKK
jgi:cytochrome c oxidase subunit 2